MELALTTTVTSDPNSPKTFEGAISSDKCKQWESGITKEFNNIKQKNVWKEESTKETHGKREKSAWNKVAVQT